MSVLARVRLANEEKYANLITDEYHNLKLFAKKSRYIYDAAFINETGQFAKSILGRRVPLKRIHIPSDFYVTFYMECIIC